MKSKKPQEPISIKQRRAKEVIKEGVNMVRTFEQIEREVLALPLTYEEKIRIGEELDLFEERGWNDYVALAINIISEVEEKVRFCFTGFSALDSLFVLKATNKYIPENFVNKKHAKDILFNDAFRLNIEVVYAYKKELNYYTKLAYFIISEMTRMNPGLKFYTKTVDKSEKKKRIFAVAKSNMRATAEDLKVIEFEKRDGPREEINVLNKYFLIYLSSHQGI